MARRDPSERSVLRLRVDLPDEPDPERSEPTDVHVPDPSAELEFHRAHPGD